MNLLLSLITGGEDDRVHSILSRYGKGIFEGPALEAAVSRGKVKASGSYLYLPILAQVLAERCETDLSVQGVIISKNEIAEEIGGHGLQIVEVKKRGGIKYRVSGVLEPSRFNAIYEELPDAALLLRAKARGHSLSSGSNIPKPNKYSDPSFCKLTMPASEENRLALLNAVVPGAAAGTFEKISVLHTIRVEELLVPPEVSGKPASVARRLAKRGGTLSRRIIMDDKTSEEDFHFLA